ncbi:MAG: helix-turn-helix domain-containing protein, partial [Candidatus Korarchaeota archaeon]|nr:helix-turn-helix domain-containing protein [Candidatus Korarchaeota archaeon]
PRRIKTRELASVLGMKPSTLTEILRRALRKLIVEHYGEIAVRNHDSI